MQLPEMGSVWQQTLGWQPDGKQQEQFQQLYTRILAGNQRLNLTRITDPLEFWEKHLWDSLRGIVRYLQEETDKYSGIQAIDIGTGAGFPGIPVAIARSDWQVTLLDSTQKKIAFLATLLQELELVDTVPLVGRAEQLGQQAQHRESYDLAMIRAVGSASTCAEYGLPFLKVGGVAVLYRGQWTEADTIALESAVEQLGGTIEKIDSFTTPLSQSVRHCLSLRKLQSTPSLFPRPVGVPNHHPLSSS